MTLSNDESQPVKPADVTSSREEPLSEIIQRSKHCWFVSVPHV